jgi:hypothetical protein
VPRQEFHVLAGCAGEVRTHDMTTEFDNQSAGSEPADGDTLVQVCPACAHDVSVHDATAIRYCRASQDRGLDRGCMCPAGSAAKAAQARTVSAPGGAGTPMYGRGRFSGK